MFPEYIKQITDEAVFGYPGEVVWLITEEGCTQVENVHAEPSKAFRISDADLLWGHKKGLKAVVHSHPDGPDCPSEADMQGQLDTSVPWGIISTDGQAALPIFWWGEEVPKEPLIGRGFRHGVTDCYALIKDYYAEEHGIHLPEFPRDWGWWTTGADLYSKGFPVAGFRRFDPDVEAPKAGDMWFSQLRSDVPNHGGIFLGADLILHHVTSTSAVDASRLSRREPIHRWLPHITYWLRHEELEE